MNTLLMLCFLGAEVKLPCLIQCILCVVRTGIIYETLIRTGIVFDLKPCFQKYPRTCGLGLRL